MATAAFEAPRLRIFYRCTTCGCIGEGDGYNLRTMWGLPMICSGCRA